MKASDCMQSGVHGWQYEVLPCPFCDRGQINCKYFPSALSIKRNVTASLPGKGSIYKSKEVWIVLSGCGLCGKSREEVEKKLREEGII